MTGDQKQHKDADAAGDGAGTSPLHSKQAQGKGLHANDFDDVASAAAAAEHYDGAVGRDKHSQSDVLLKEAQLASKSAPPSKFQKIQGAILPIVVLVIIIGLVVMLFIINSTPAQHGSGAIVSPIDYSCFEQCRTSLVESVPSDLSLGGALPGNQATLSAWTNLIASATTSIDVMTRWLSLLPVGNSSSSGAEGKTIFDALAAAAKRGVALTILLDDSASSASPDADALKNAAGSVLVKQMNFSGLLGGELYGTAMVVDDKHFYLGSAELSQSSLTQRKELGVAVYNCSCMAAELARLFEGYVLLDDSGSNTSSPWPANLAAHFNLTMPLNVTLAVDGTSSGSNVAAFVTASVASPYSVQSMSLDSDAILAAMAGASSEIDIAVANYAPVTDDGSTFWPVIDNAIRSAAVRQQARVRLLVGAREPADNGTELLVRYLVSLASFSSRIQVRLFVVPHNASLGSTVAASVVSDSNYLVTDSVAFVGTSDWTASSFTSAFRMGLVVNETSVGPTAGSLRAHLQAAFNRDWSSQYARNLTSGMLAGIVTCLP